MAAPEPARLTAPFSVYGGKKYLAARVAALIPNHRTYVEPFMGAASVLFAKAPSPTEALSDIDQNKVRVLRFIRDHFSVDRLNLLERDWTPSRSRFMILKDAKPKENIDWMYRELYLRWNSFGCRGDSWALNNAAAGWERYLTVRMPAYKERLRGVEILHQDWKRTLLTYDAPDTFFYLDPPYLGTSNDRAAHFDEPSAPELHAMLSRRRGKWLMSNSADKVLIATFLDYHISYIKVPTQIDQMHRGALRDRTEVLISNYRLPR